MYDPMMEVDINQLRENDRLESIEKTLARQEEEKAFCLKINNILKILFKNADVIKIQLYENIIVDFVKGNVRKELFNDDCMLMNIIKAYIEFLTKKDISIDRLLYINSFLNGNNNEVRREIERRYLNSKFVLISSCELFGLNIQEHGDDIIDIMLEMYQDTSTRNNVFNSIYKEKLRNNNEDIILAKQIGELINAFDNILLIKSNSTIANEIDERERKSIAYTGRH